MKVQGRGAPNDIVEAGDGLKIPAQVTVTAEDVNGYTAELTARYTAESGRYEVDWLTVRRGDDGQEVTGEGLRSIPVAAILRDGILSALSGFTLLQAGAAPEDLGRSGPTDETLRWVARVYRFALLVGDAPTQAVASSLDIPRATAARWVTRARDRSMLTVSDPRGGGRGG
ncbi:hypothetical protein [Phytoactinopolyspora halophila]|uniref:hypothetical protein n=1 Tax=Phytoactinopolyspora halophila TaxID=1981511 RepID=UPI001B8ABD2A|nr:hypothetical protein [Phytoactinopolyspora halophila]